MNASFRIGSVPSRILQSSSSFPILSSVLSSYPPSASILSKICSSGLSIIISKWFKTQKSGLSWTTVSASKSSLMSCLLSSKLSLNVQLLRFLVHVFVFLFLLGAHTITSEFQLAMLYPFWLILLNVLVIFSVNRLKKHSIF